MAQINSVAKTYIGAAALTTANANDCLAVRISTASGTNADGQSTVTLSTAHATQHFDEIVGAYAANPGHEGNPVSINVKGEFAVQVNAAVTAAHYGRGLISSTVAGVAEVAPAPANTGAAKIGFGRVQGGFSEGGKHYAIVLV